MDSRGYPSRRMTHVDLRLSAKTFVFLFHSFTKFLHNQSTSHHLLTVESHLSTCSSGAMEDRLSSLPEDLLHSILRDLPLKHAARTSALSRRWVPQWIRALADSPVLDFTDRDFARGQRPRWVAASGSTPSAARRSTRSAWR